MATSRNSNASPKLDIAIAELSILLKTAVADISDIKTQLSIMHEQFARRDEVDANRASIELLKTEMGNMRTSQAVIATKLATWGIIGGIIITLLSAAISALQIHL